MKTTRFPLVQLVIVAVFLVLLLPVNALAQQGIVPLTALTPYAMLVSVLTLLAGVLTTAINAKTIAGKTIPTNVMVWLMIVAPFVAAVGASFQAAGKLDAVSTWNALVAGIVAVIAGAVPGAALHLGLHAHLEVPKLVQARYRGKPASNDNANATAQKPAA